MTAHIDPSNLFIKSSLFKDALRKIFIIYLLICNEPLNENDIRIDIIDNKKSSQVIYEQVPVK